MSALDILPPSAPGGAQQQRSGFFSKIFKRKEEGLSTPPAPSPREELASFDRSLEDETFDLEEIRRKLGIEEDQQAGETKGTPEVERPAAEPTSPPEEPSFSIEQPIAVESPVKLEQSASPFDSLEDELPELPPHTAPPAGDDEWATEPQASQEKDTGWDAPAEPAPPAEEPLPGVSAEPVEAGTGGWAEEATPQEPAEPSGPAPAEPKPEEVAKAGASHFAELEEQHRALEKDLQALIKEGQPALPAAEHPLEKPAPEGQEFILKNGQPLKSIRELLEALDSIDQETFFHHVNTERNDFANWLQHVFQEEGLADEIRQAKSRKEIMKILNAHSRAAEKRFAEEGKRLDSGIKARAEKLTHAAKLDGRLAELKAELARKSSQLAEERQLLNDEVSKRLAHEVGRRVREERKSLQQLQKEAERKKAEYEKRTAAVGAALDKRGQRLAEQEEALKQQEAALKAEQERFSQDRGQAQPLLQQAAAVEEKMNSIAAERTRLEEERKRLFEEREKLGADRRAMALREANATKREAAVVKERESFAGRTDELAKQEAQLKRRQEEFLQLKTAFEQQERTLRGEEKRTLAKLREEQRAAEEKTKKVAKAEEKLNAQLRERRKVAKYIEEAEQNISRHEEKLQQEGLHGYLKGKLKALGSAAEEDASAPPPATVKNLKIYATIDKARQALEHGEVAQARDLYNKARESFNREKLSPSEKSVLYTTIRELYDDIHLASLQ